MDKHTELPWVHDQEVNIYSSDVTGSIVGTVDGFRLAPRPQEEKIANAEFIVRACNNFYPMLGFVDDIISMVFDGYTDIDGADIQDVAVKHGLLKEVEVTESCGEHCACEEFGDFPATCYRKAYKQAESDITSKG